MKVNMYRWKLQHLERNRERLERRMDALKAREHLLHNRFEDSIITWKKGLSVISKFEEYLEFLEKGLQDDK